MVNYSDEELDPVFAALADPTRRAILARLSHGEATVTQVAEPFETSLPAISRHVKVLEQAGLISRRKEGRIHHLRLVGSSLKEAVEWLDQVHWFWETQFEALETLLKEDGDGQTGKAR
jgi:DNA-binding transcriptional ArsR family regulator